MALIHHWPLSDNAASTTVAATVGTNATANTNTDTLTTAGPGGQIAAGFDFDGTAEEVDISAASVSFASGSAFSVSCWVEFDAATGRFVGISGAAIHRVAKTSDTVIQVQSSTTTLSFSVPSLGTTLWHHVLVTRDASNNCRLFVDGAESSSGAQSLPGTFAPTRLARSNTSYFDGKIAGVKIFDTDESANVAALYAEGTFSAKPAYAYAQQ